MTERFLGGSFDSTGRSKHPLFVTFLSLQELPVVAKLFVPSVRCPICCHANDSDFRYCQRCGYKTLHGFRSGCAITLALTGAELSEIMDHVGWSNRHTALYYMQLAKVLNPCGASAKLASSEVFNIPHAWQDINELKRFVCAFPTDNPHKKLFSQ